MKIHMYDGTTNTSSEVELEGEEAANLSEELAKLSSEREARMAKIEADKIAKSALLEKLGITAEEAALLLA